MTVPSLSIAFMGVSALLSIGVPVALLIVFHKKYGAKVVPALTGAVAFIVFAMGLEQLMHFLVLKPAADGTIALRSQPILYMLYGCFAAGIFEETARYVSYKLLCEKYSGIRTALSYGVGHGGIEAILIGGLTMVSSIVIALSAGSGSAASQALAIKPSYMFLISGIERMLALTIQIALSVVVFYSVYGERKFWLYPLAILLHALIDAPAALMQAGVLGNVLIVEGMIAVFAVALAFFAAYVHRRLKPAERSSAPEEGETRAES
jgi:uncharacterized membrane protein YhfC